MLRKYKNPPVIEAICEFRLNQNTPWDLTVPGMFYERIKEEFPHRESRVVPKVEFVSEPYVFEQRIVISEHILLLSEDRKRFIQLGPRLLVLNVLKPYPTWQKFKPIIEKVWRNLLEIVKVNGFERISLRYINEIKISEQSFRLDEYFNFYPYIGLPQKPVFFILGSEFSYEGENDRCRVNLTPATGRNVLILDIDYFLTNLQNLSLEQFMDWIEKAHNRVEEIFDGCITDKLKSVFKEVFPNDKIS